MGSGPILCSVSREFINTISSSVFKEFDDRYTAPLHGFADAEDYWNKASSLQFIHAIMLPTLMLSATDDSILTHECFPVTLAKEHKNVLLEISRYGGHCGFIDFSKYGSYWHERRIMRFLLDAGG